MSRVPTVRKADLDRVLKALADAGQRAGRVVVRPGGEVEITPALTGEAPTEQRDELSEWRARRDARSVERP